MVFDANDSMTYWCVLNYVGLLDGMMMGLLG